jgi:hypothetical protein
LPPAHVVTLPTQSSKSQVKQVVDILFPVLDRLLAARNGQEVRVYPMVFIPPFVQHGNVMAKEIRLRAALMSLLAVSLDGGKPLRVRKVLWRDPEAFDEIVVRCRGSADKKLNTIGNH